MFANTEGESETEFEFEDKKDRKWVTGKEKVYKIITDHVDPERPAIYVAQSRTPDSNSAFITPEKPTMARKPPPEPAMAITGTYNIHNVRKKKPKEYLIS